MYLLWNVTSSFFYFVLQYCLFLMMDWIGVGQGSIRVLLREVQKKIAEWIARIREPVHIRAKVEGAPCMHLSPRRGQCGQFFGMDGIIIGLHNHSAGDFKPTTSGHCSSHTPTDDSYGYGYVHTLHASVVTPWLQPFSLLPWSELPDCPSSLLSLSPWPHADTHHEWVCTCPPRFQNPWPASNALLGCFDFRLKFNSDHIFEC